MQKLRHLDTSISEALDGETLLAIADGKLDVSILHYEGKGLDTLRANRDRLAALGEPTLRNDALIAYAERYTREPVVVLSDIAG